MRNGSVIDLKIEPGKVRARVMGSSLYTIEIGIAAVPDTHWKSLAKECTGSIASLAELLQGKLSKAVMERICQPKTGLFPMPRDIQLGCSCPDWAMMCKHVAAVLYGVGARLDAQPELLFTLRQVDANDLVTQAAELPVKTGKTPARSKVLDDSQLADVFGIVMDTPEVLPDTKSKAGTRRTKPAEPPAPPAMAKTPTKASAKKKAVGATRPTTDARPPTKQAQVTEAPVSVSESVSSPPPENTHPGKPLPILRLKRKGKKHKSDSTCFLSYTAVAIFGIHNNDLLFHSLPVNSAAGRDQTDQEVNSWISQYISK